MFKKYNILVICTYIAKTFLTEMLLLSYFIYFLIPHIWKSDQLRHEFQEITSHHGVAVANRWIKTTLLPSPSARGHCHKVATSQKI